MADVENIVLNGVTLSVADATARTQISSLGTTIAGITEQLGNKQNTSMTNPVIVKGLNQTTVEGAVGALADAVNNLDITVDDSLSTASVNPVQNRIITAHLIDTDANVTTNTTNITTLMGSGDGSVTKTVSSAITAYDTDTVTPALDLKQPKTLASPITVDGVQRTTVESAITALNDKDTEITSLIPSDADASTNKLASVKTVTDAIDALPAVLVPKGTIAFTSLPALSDTEIGDMYNISTDFTTTEDFVTSGVDMKAGSNVYCVNSGTDASPSKKWDVFAVGVVDLSSYYTKTETDALVNNYVLPVAAMPASPVDDQLVWYMGATTADYVNGAVYQYSAASSTWGVIWTPSSSITVDDELSTTSENPVQNKVISSALAKLDKAALSVLTLPTASAELENMVRFNVADEKWYLCVHDTEADTYDWKDLSPVIPDPDLSKYSKNLIIDKASDITAAQIAEYDTFDTTDNECGMVFGEVAEGDHNAVDGDSVYSALSGKVNTSDLTSDVTSGSTQPVTSGGVYSAILNRARQRTVGGDADLDDYTSPGVYSFSNTITSTAHDLPISATHGGVLFVYGGSNGLYQIFITNLTLSIGSHYIYFRGRTNWYGSGTWEAWKTITYS